MTVPASLDVTHGAVEEWLFGLGNWSAYGADRSVEQDWPDPFRCRAEDLLAWMAERRVHALIDSFHDDTAWVVALGG